MKTERKLNLAEDKGLLEPYVGKLTRTVLRRVRGSNPSILSDQFPHQNGEQQARLTVIDALNNLVINDLVFDKDEFDKDLVEAFLDSSLEGLPKEAMITDGDTMYPDILKKIGIKHQLCIFHIIKNHHDNSFKSIRKVKRRIKTINNQIPANKTTIEHIKNQIRNNNLSKKKKDKKRKKIKDLEQKK